MNQFGYSVSDLPKIVTKLPGPKTEALIKRDQTILSPSYTRDYPLVAKRGIGCLIEDVDGNQFLDFSSGIAVTSTGHCHPEVVATITEQAATLIHMSGTDFYYEVQVELAEKLAALIPGQKPQKVFFTNSGAETIEAAFKLARYHTTRRRMISFYGAFHGRTFGAMSLAGSKAVHQRGFGPLVEGVHRLPYNCQRDAFETLFRHVAAPDEVAAVIVEPVQGEAGYLVPDPHFLPMIREICDQHGILMICDEVQAGIGRTGKMFASEHFLTAGSFPDILCLAKGIASGMPLGAIVTKAEVMSWEYGSHASTFGGNPISCRAALKTLELVENHYLPEVAAKGERLQAGLKQLSKQFPQISPSRGLGLMVAVDTLKTDGQINPQLQGELLLACYKQGLLLLGCGKSGVRFCPALCVTDAEVDRAIELFGAACQSLFAG